MNRPSYEDLEKYDELAKHFKNAEVLPMEDKVNE